MQGSLPWTSTHPEHSRQREPARGLLAVCDVGLPDSGFDTGFDTFINSNVTHTAKNVGGVRGGAVGGCV